MRTMSNRVILYDRRRFWIKHTVLRNTLGNSEGQLVLPNIHVYIHENLRNDERDFRRNCLLDTLRR